MINSNQANTKAVIYARFSPRKNADDCESCDTQIDYCTKYCEFHKMDVVQTFQDEALSGAEAENRPGLQSAMEYAIKHKASLVIYSLDRLSRSLRDAIDLSDKLRKAKIDLCSITQQIDTSTAIGNMFFQIIAMFAEWDRRQTSEKTSAAMRRHQATGRRMSARLPFGWRRDPDNPARMLPNDYELEIIDEMKEARDEGYSLRAIADYLTRSKFIPRSTVKQTDDGPVEVKGIWHFGTIRRILDRVERDVF